MLGTWFSRIAIAAIAVVLAAGLALPQARAQGPALTGQVTSAEEGAMEGVIVSAKRDGSNITVSVITNDQGTYTFPAARLEPGSYKVEIRAAGYELDGSKSASVVAGQLSTL